MQHKARNHFVSSVLSMCSLSVFTTVSLTGCSSFSEEESETLRDTDEPGSVAMLDAGAPQSEQDGGSYRDASDEGAANTPDAGDASRSAPFFVAVRANGTGCPAGTTNVSISPDGTRISAYFATFEAVVDKDKSIDVENCHLGIKLHSPKGMSFGLRSFYLQGYAFLEKGQKARQVAKVYFQGEPARNQREVRTDLVGPFDDSYTFQDLVGAHEVAWSPCGTTRDLNINMVLRLQNDATKTQGYINMEMVTDFKLAWRICG